MARRGKRHNKTGRADGGEQFLAIPHTMARSPAWRSLSGPALKVFIELACRFNGANNGHMSLSLDEGARVLGLGKSTVARALDELQDKGFIVLKRRGHWYGRRASEYGLTTKSMNGMPATHAWKQWRPETEKTDLGSEAGHIRTLTGPLQNRD
jgi:hypothetical protein